MQTTEQKSDFGTDSIHKINIFGIIAKLIFR